MKCYLFLSILFFSTFAAGEELITVNESKDRRVIKSVTLTPQDFSTASSQISINDVIYDLSSPRIARVTDQHNIEFNFEVSIEDTQHTDALLEEARRENEGNSNRRLRRIVGVSPVLHKASISFLVPMEKADSAINCQELRCKPRSYVLKKWFAEVPPELSDVYRAIGKELAIELTSVRFENATGVLHSMTIAVVEYETLYPFPTTSPGISIGN